MSIKINVITDFVGTGLKKATAEFKQLEGAGKKTGFLIKKSLLPATAALGAFGGFMLNAAKGAEDARIANQKLGNVLDSMGFAEATDRVSAYAESLEKTIAVDADVIKATQTKLATFSNLTKTVNQAGGAFDRATKAALDMAAAGFGTAEGNAVQLGKALQNPIKGIAALAKSGIDFTEQEKEKIRTLVESNKLLEAQDMILAAIEKQVGGTAEESASSFEKLKFALAGVADTFGDMLLPAIDAIAPKLQAFALWAEENPGLMKLVTGAFVGLTAAVVALNIAMALNPVVLIAAAIAGLIGLLVVAYAKFEGFRKGVDWVINQIIWNFETMANAFIDAINIVIRGINLVKPGSDIAKLEKVQFGRLGQTRTGAGVGGLGGGLMNEMKGVPRMADGGIIRHSPGGTLALIGEGGRDEAVIPLDRMGSMGGNNITINVQGADPNAVVDALRTYMFRNGSVPIRVS
jgi:phage-related protein